MNDRQRRRALGAYVAVFGTAAPVEGRIPSAAWFADATAALASGVDRRGARRIADNAMRYRAWQHKQRQETLLAAIAAITTTDGSNND